MLIRRKVEIYHQEFQIFVDKVSQRCHESNYQLIVLAENSENRWKVKLNQWYHFVLIMLQNIYGGGVETE